MPKSTWFSRLVAALFPHRRNASREETCSTELDDAIEITGTYLPKFVQRVRAEFDAQAGGKEWPLVVLIAELIGEAEQTNPKFVIHLLEDCLYSLEEVDVDWWQIPCINYGTFNQHDLLYDVVGTIVTRLVWNEGHHTKVEPTATRLEDERRYASFYAQAYITPVPPPP